ncbi:outer membrane beta-barrel protein [uncultured Shimia sp.]|uniref:outer membrane protein n=1 Tax=uncultured Shimia sp. TaxID=573152 RepID=UPI00261A0604|nr:outer membrane beta-barrel protein [uncultured Shimia sp.]
MPQTTKLAAGLLALSTMCGSQALAEGFYFGAGLGYTDAESDGGGTGTRYSELDTGALGLTGGYSWDLDGSFAALEIDTDISFGSDLKQNGTGVKCSSGTSAPYFCSHDATVRLRGTYGTEVANDWSLFGSLGLGFVMGDSAVTVPGATDSAIVGGLTAGFGAQKPLGSGVLRVEFIHDNFKNTLDKPSNGTVTYDPNWEANSVKVTYLLKF